MHTVGASTYAELEEALARVNARLRPAEVHALYLGALTSTNLRLGPQQLLGGILGHDHVIAHADLMAAMPALLGYWNTLVDRRNEGRVCLAPAELSSIPDLAELLTYAKRRHEEIRWYIRGMDAGGEDPLEFGPEGDEILGYIDDGSAYLAAYVAELSAAPAANENERCEMRARLLEVVATLDHWIGELMMVSGRIRREVHDTFVARTGRATDDGARTAASMKIGRNERCRCGSGKKWKHCCGRPSRLQ
jgi:hypothetical protein